MTEGPRLSRPASAPTPAGEKATTCTAVGPDLSRPKKSSPKIMPNRRMLYRRAHRHTDV
jgi:hypothetical protein